MRLGYPYLLEWGHTIYYDNNGEYVARNNFQTKALEAWFTKTNNSYGDLENIYSAIATEAENTGYNYDGIVGILQNFQFQFLPDGSYNISLDFITRGAIIESLRANQVFNVKTEFVPSTAIAVDYSYKSLQDIANEILAGRIDDFKFVLNNPQDTYKNLSKLFQHYQLRGLIDSLIIIPDPWRGSSQTFSDTYEGIYEQGVKKFLANNKVQELTDLGINPVPLNNDAGIEVTAKDAFSSGLNFQLTRWINALRNPTTSGFSVVNEGGPDEYVYESTNHNLVSLKFQFLAGANFTKQYYIKLGHFLQWVKTNLTRSQPNLSPLINIDTSKDSFMLSHPGQGSVDPKICLIPYKDPTLGGANYILKDELGLGFKPSSNLYKGSIMNIHVNIEHIAKILRQLNKDGIISLYDLIDNLLTDINLSIGNINSFRIVYIESSNTFKIYDDQTIPGVNSSDNNKAVFQVYGINKNLNQGSFLEEFTFNSELFSSVATSIAISSTSVTTQGYNTSPFKSINKLTKNKFAPIVVTSTATTESVSVREQLPELITQIYDLNLRYMYVDPERVYPGDDTVEALKDTLHNVLEYDLQDRVRDDQTPDLEFIPLVTTCKMRGLGGIKIYQKFDIEPKEIIPSNYTTQFDFIIKTIDHEISNNKWITSIGTMMYPRNKNQTNQKVFNADKATSSPSTQSAPLPKTSNIGKNGRLAANQLTPIPGGKNNRTKELLIGGPAEDFIRMFNAAKAEGIDLIVNSSYRTYKTQYDIFDWGLYVQTGGDPTHQELTRPGVEIEVKIPRKRPPERKKINTNGLVGAAFPGTSNHGWGKAVDIDNRAGQVWIKKNGYKYNWSWYEGRSVGEPWHFTWTTNPKWLKDWT